MTAHAHDASAVPLPYLSHSRLQKYLHCPEQYRLYYVENLRPRIPSASLVFGQVVHQALAHLFRTQGDPVRFFEEQWAEAHQWDLRYSARDSWETLHTAGRSLLAKFVREELPRLGTITASEQAFELAITSLDVPFVGVIDLVADVDEKPTVVDFKTSDSAYQPHEVVLSDQLTAYQLAEPQTAQMALCVFVKTREPRIEWHVAQRAGAQLVEYLAKAKLVGAEITAGHFYKRPGKWCAWCDYLPVCVGDEVKAQQTLV